MSAASLTSHSKPKIHRLPIAALPPSREPTTLYSIYGPALFWVLLSLAVIATTAVLYKKRHEPSEHASVAVGNAGDLLQKLQENTPDKTTEVPTSIAEVAKDGLFQTEKTIVLKGKSDTIIGQMVKIPQEMQQITEIKPASGVDNGTGPELLSIIGKY